MRKLFTFLFASMVCSAVCSAQDFRTSYFLSNYIYDYRINPAFMGDSFKGFVSAGVGNVTASVQASFPMNAFIYKENGRYCFGLNKDYTLEKLTSTLPTFSKANVSVNENLLAAGWTGKKTAGTIEVNLRSYNSAYFDIELVKMACNGFDDVPYGIGNTKASTRNWIEVAYGYKNRVSDNFSFGARLKGLVGLAFSDLNAPDYFCYYNYIDESGYYVDGNGTFRSSNTFLTYSISDGKIDPRQPKFGHYSIGGFGAAADLGLKLTTRRNLEITVAFLDLGGLVWNNKIYGKVCERPCLDEDDIYRIMEANPDSPASFVWNPVTVEAGARYPFGSKFSAGALATIRIDNTARGWYEIRAGGAYSPAKVFSVAASAAINTLGAGIGFALNLRIPGIAFTLGSDSILGLFAFNSDFIPYRKLNTDLHAGLSVAW